MQTASSTTPLHVCASRSTGKERDSETGLDYFVVDPKGNAIPVKTGEQSQGSKDGSWVQVKDANGQQTRTRIDGGHPSTTHPDTRAQVPHAHAPGAKNADGTPWLPVKQ
jgi:hypothetical protein